MNLTDLQKMQILSMYLVLQKQQSKAGKEKLLDTKQILKIALAAEESSFSEEELTLALKDLIQQCLTVIK